MRKRLEEIKEEIAKEKNCEDWAIMIQDYGIQEEIMDEVAIRYAREVAQASLERASYNATIRSLNMFGGDFIGSPKMVDKQSITNPDNIVL